MSDLMNLSYQRLDERTGVLQAIQRHPDAYPRIWWAGSTHTSGGPVAAMAMVWLYELVLYRSGTTGPHPLGELIRCRRDPRPDARPDARSTTMAATPAATRSPPSWS